MPDCPATAMRSPSGDQATSCTAPSKIRRTSKVTMSRTFTSSKFETTAIDSLSGDQLCGPHTTGRDGSKPSATRTMRSIIGGGPPFSVSPEGRGMSCRPLETIQSTSPSATGKLTVPRAGMKAIQVTAAGSKSQAILTVAKTPAASKEPKVQKTN